MEINYGEKLKRLRQFKGYTQKDCAEALNMHKNTYSKYEKNPDLFSLGKFRQLLEFLKISYYEIYD